MGLRLCPRRGFGGEHRCFVELVTRRVGGEVPPVSNCIILTVGASVTIGFSGRSPSMADQLRDGRTLLAEEHRALMTFARASGMSVERLQEGVFEIDDRGRVTVGLFPWCRVTDISALANCTGIRWVWLEGNEIADISALARCRELVWLSLKRNRITDISALANCGKLDLLHLSENGLTDISALGDCANLERLFLGNNDLTDISALANCRRLTHLQLNNNRLTEITALARCGMLEEVLLFDNQITELSALAGCSRLSFVSLRGNPLSDAALGVIERLRCRGVRIHP